MKICSACKKEKSIKEFHKNKSSKDGLQYQCISCHTAQRNNWYLENKEIAYRASKNYYEQNKEYYTEYSRQHYKNNKKRKNRYCRERRASDLNFKLAHNLRKRIGLAIKNNQKTGSAVSDLGCSIDFFRSYIEKQFKPNMSWSNYGEWHLDHIQALANFDLTDRKQFIKAAHYTNYQPLWAKDNIIKSNK